MNRRNLIQNIGAIATGTTITALAGCTGNGDNNGDPEPEPEPEPEPDSRPDDGISVIFNPSDAYEEHITYGNASIDPANPDDGRPIGMTVSWEITVDSAPDDAPCIGTDIGFNMYDESGEVYWNVVGVHGETYTVGDSTEEEYYLPVPTEDLDDPDALDTPSEVEVIMELNHNETCE